MTTDPLAVWCCGWHRHPHVPDHEALVDTNLGTGVRLCRTCWRAWIATDHERTRP